MTTQSPPQDTRIEAYREVKDAGEDETLRRQVAAALAEESMTTHELTQRFPDRSANAIRPRVNELLRMHCVEREGKRMNPSGHEAYVHHLTPTGRAYLANEIDPPIEPNESELKSNIVEIAREVAAGNASLDILRLSIERLDDHRRRMDPDAGGRP